MSKNFFIPNELMVTIKNHLGILHQAIEADENPEQQIAYRMQCAIGTFDPDLDLNNSRRTRFQIVVEIIVDERYFLEDGDIEIITDPIHKPEPYKIKPPEK